MSVLERRLQLLLSQEQFDRLSAEASASGRSVNAVVRSAIDQALPRRECDAVAEFRALLRRESASSGPGEECTDAELKEQFEADYYQHPEAATSR